jgi:hypothetical protein
MARSSSGERVGVPFKKYPRGVLAVNRTSQAVDVTVEEVT